MHSKFKLILKILLRIIIGIICFLFISLFIIMLIQSPKPISKITDYKKCLEAVINKDKIRHFPKSIPLEAKSYLYCYPADYEGQGELVILRLTTDKSYIQKELSVHSFLNAETKIGTSQEIYFMPTENVEISNKELTFFVLRDKDNESFYKTYFPYFLHFKYPNYKDLIFLILSLKM